MLDRSGNMVNRFIVINKHHIEKDYLKIMIKNNQNVFIVQVRMIKK